MKLSYKKLIMCLSLALPIAFSAPLLASAQNTDASYENSETSAAYREAKALMDSGDFKLAIKTLTTAQSNGEDTFEASQLLSEAYQNRIDEVGLLKKRSLAIKMRKTMEHSLSLEPSSAEARENLIRFHIKAPGAVGGNKDTARELVKGFTNLGAAKQHLYQSLISTAEKDLAAARAHLDKALALDPQNAEALISRGNFQIQEKAYPDAIVTFETCTGFHSGNMGCHYLIGKASHVGNIQTQKGIAALEVFTETGGEGEALTAHAHYRLGELYARTGETEAARTSFEQAIAINGLKLAKSSLAKLE